MDYTTSSNIGRAVSAFEKIANSMAMQPMPTLVPSPVDVQPIADALLEGLAAIASAVEYKAQLEDARLRDLNKQENRYLGGLS